MERTKAADDVKPLWRKTTTGKLYLPHRKSEPVKHKEAIRATAEQLGSMIRHFELVEEGTGAYAGEGKVAKQKVAESTATHTPADKESYSVEHAGTGWYNVVSSSGKVMNEKKLRSAEAEALKNSLEQDTPVE